MNRLYHGDNLDIVREHIPDELLDLIHLDPPFNSNRSYNVLLRGANGTAADSQIQAFDDTWSWRETAEATLHEIVTTADPHIVEMIEAIVSFVGRNDVTAYLVMMTIRLVELHRVLKPTGSIYLHCDPTASHYLKVVMDTVFGASRFRNEIVWKRFNFHADAKRFGKVSDRILFYTKGTNFTFNRLRVPFSEKYVASKFRHSDERGRFRLSDLNPPGGRGPVYEFHGVTKPWRFTKERMLQLEGDGRIYTRSRVAQVKRYLDELSGQAVHHLWTDIPPINPRARERLGYPTQKPLALLERIVQASSNRGDLVLDPFCGCGTTVVAAQKLGRQWIGIDITHLAISLMRQRLADMFGDEVDYEVVGQPVDAHSARALALQDRFQFEWWALGLIPARPANKRRRGADQGLDGIVFFIDEAKKKAKKVAVQVKSGHVQSSQIRDLYSVVEREKAVMGFFLTLEPPTKPMTTEALSAGYYHSPGWNTDYQKIQIRTIEQLLDGEKFDMPAANITLARAGRVEQQSNQGELL